MIERTMIENQDLKQLILQYTSYDHRIYDNTSISRDLEIQDEQAFDFIEAYSKQFNVDISAFNFIKYFPSVDTKIKSHKRKDLTIADLARGIIVGELNDDVITFDENDANLPPEFTTKKIILGIVLVLAVSAILGAIAIYI